MSSKVTITYNGSTIVPEYTDSNTTVPVTYNGSTIANIAVGNTKTLNTKGTMAKTNIVIGNKTLNCAGTYMSGNVGVTVAAVPVRVGGRVYYVDSNGGSGATYTFYDSSMNVLSTQTVSGLANAYYYTKTGKSSSDKFYIYDNTSHTTSSWTASSGLVTSQYWGYYDTFIGVTTDGIGYGKSNTNTVLALGVPTDHTPNIWGYIKACRDNSLNGCNDWYIASMAEQNPLKSSGLVSWYDNYHMWSSVEFSDSGAYNWFYDSAGWDIDNKNDCLYSCFAARSI